MIELTDNELAFTFPTVHPQAGMRIVFQRTLRIPDDGRAYPLPPGLGAFPLRHVDDFAGRVPGPWVEHGGVMLPMYQAEAMWLYFGDEYLPDRESSYPCAVKIATGKINAVSGEAWSNGLHARPQDYLVVPTQPWLDGYSVEKGFIRQFVAMPLGSGYSAEEQLTGEAAHGGLQIAVYPMKREVFERRFPKLPPREESMDFDGVSMACCPAPGAAMGLAPGGRMRQEIYDDPFGLDDWDQSAVARCFVHIANSMVWRAITGALPPTPPLTAKEYDQAGLPWFDYYSDAPALGGSAALNGLKSVAEMAAAKGDVALPENQSVPADHVIRLRRGLKEGQVREGAF